jgi:hypothetical protein
VRALSHVFFFSTLVRCGEYRSQTGIQRKLNFVSVRTIKERSSPASRLTARGGSTTKVCVSLDLYTSCKPTHSEIPFAILCGPSVYCACPVLESFGKMMICLMDTQDSVQQRERAKLVLGCIIFSILIVFIVNLVTLINVTKDGSCPLGQGCEFQIVILSSVPFMFLVVTGYRWVQWKREKQILEKFLSEEGIRKQQRDAIIQTLTPPQAQQVREENNWCSSNQYIIHHHSC